MESIDTLPVSNTSTPHCDESGELTMERLGHARIHRAHLPYVGPPAFLESTPVGLGFVQNSTDLEGSRGPDCLKQVVTICDIDVALGHRNPPLNAGFISSDNRSH